MKRITLIVTALAVMSALSVGFIGLVSDDSEGAPLPEHHASMVALHKTYYTNSASESFWLTEVNGQEGAAFGEIIGTSYYQGTLSVDRSGAPSWINYDFVYSRHDVRFTISPGAPIDDTFWILFNVGNGRMLLLVLFEITVIDSGSVIPDENYKTFTLKFDTNGGTVISDYSVQSLDTTYTFDLSAISTPARTGFKFVGWSTDNSGQTVLINSTWTLVITNGSNAVSGTLYAVYESSSSSDDDKLVIPMDSVYDMLVELFSNTTLLVILAGGLLGVAVLFRIFRRGSA